MFKFKKTFQLLVLSLLILSLKNINVYAQNSNTHDFIFKIGNEHIKLIKDDNGKVLEEEHIIDLTKEQLIDRLVEVKGYTKEEAISKIDSNKNKSKLQNYLLNSSFIRYREVYKVYHEGPCATQLGGWITENVQGHYGWIESIDSGYFKALSSGNYELKDVSMTKPLLASSDRAVFRASGTIVIETSRSSTSEFSVNNLKMFGFTTAYQESSKYFMRKHVGYVYNYTPFGRG
ncbi:hypothetical protein K144316041_00250 [Clostridium tetani]|uniref:hypothetical protein n=1 Tax=Clostridium tetani TaxID=1513 RepID=UPI002953BDA5|nr:hypothetical protein [Clostridium tetani]BDR71317.1 hypothetical protein K144316041_00250 [Clostridium tetani]